MKKFLRCLSVTVIVGLTYSPLETIASTNQKLLFHSQTIASTEFELKDFKFWYNQCLLLSQEKQYTETLAACEQAISLKPKDKNIQLWSARSEALFYTNRYAESLASYDRVLINAPNHSQALTYQCAALFNLAKYEDAVDRCEKALQVNGNWENTSPSLTWVYKGLALRKLGRLDNALSSYNRALSMNPNDSLIIAERCSLIAEIGEYGKEKDCGLQQAIASYENAVANDSNNATIWIQQGLALEQAGLFESALTSYDKASQLSPKNAFILVHRCSVLNALENYKAALESCDQALANIQQTEKFFLANIWTQRSGALTGLGKYEEALANAKRAVAINSEYAPSYNALAVSLWGLNRFLEARVEIERTINIYNQQKEILRETFSRNHQTPTEFYRGLFLAYYNQGRIFASTVLAKAENQKAVDAYKKSLASFKDYKKTLNIQQEALDYDLGTVDKRILSNIYANQAGAYLRLKSYQNAFKQSDVAVSINPESFAGWYNKALALSKLSEIDKKNKSIKTEALQAYEKADTLNPNNRYVLTGKGLVLQDLGRFADALATFDKVLALDPTNIKIIAAKGTALEKLKRFQEAIAIYDQVLGNEPDNTNILMGKASALQELRKFDDAIAIYDNLLKKKPSDYIILTAKGTALENSGKIDRAIAIYKQALDIEPDYKLAKERYEALKKIPKNTEKKPNK
jgi:tetratricopeptide (TPR) repeat protein